MGTFLHDIGKPLGRLRDKETIAILLDVIYQITGSTSLSREKLERYLNDVTQYVKRLNKEKRSYKHIAWGLLLITLFGNLDTQEIDAFEATEREKGFWNELEIDIQLLKELILHHHSNLPDQIPKITCEIEDNLKISLSELLAILRASDHMGARGERTPTEELKTPSYNLHNLIPFLAPEEEQIQNRLGLGLNTMVRFTHIGENVHLLLNSEFYTDNTKEIHIHAIREWLKNWFIFGQQIRKTLDKGEKVTFETLLGIMDLLTHKYLYFTPADIRERTPFIPLYEHLYSTALFATNILQAILQQRRRKDSQYILRIMILDLPSIQKFIYDIHSTKYALKTLKGKSVFIQLLLEDIKLFIAKKLQLSPFFELFNAGGKIALLIPDLPGQELDEKIKNLQAEIEEKLFMQFHGELRLVLGISPKDRSISIKRKDQTKYQFDVKAFYSHLTEALQITSKELKNLKYKPLKSILWKEEKETNKIKISRIIRKIKVEKDIHLCELCNKYPALYEDQEDVRLCTLCSKYVTLGEYINKLARVYTSSRRKDKQPYVLSLQLPQDGNEGRNKISLLFHDLILESIKQQKAKGIVLMPLIYHHTEIPNSKTFITHILRSKRVYQFNLPLGIALQKERIATLEELSKIDDKDNEKSTYLAILKGDVDNLGKIFRNLSETYKLLYQKHQPYPISFSRTVSFWIKFFYEHAVNHLVSTLINKEKFKLYTTYIGGDDFVILGRWDHVLKLLIKMQRYWEKFTLSNPYLTFSAAISLFKPYTPILYVIETAEAALTKAKYHNINQRENLKNKVAFNQTVYSNPKFCSMIRSILEKTTEETNTHKTETESLHIPTDLVNAIILTSQNIPEKLTSGFLYQLLKIIDASLNQQKDGDKDIFSHFAIAKLYYLLKRRNLISPIETFSETSPWVNFANSFVRGLNEEAKDELLQCRGVLEIILYLRRLQEAKINKAAT